MPSVFIRILAGCSVIFLIAAPRAAASRDGLLVVSRSNHRVLEFNAQTGEYVGVVVNISTLPSLGSFDPYGLFLGENGHLFVGSANSGPVVEIDVSDSGSPRHVHTYGPGSPLDIPRGICEGPANTLLVGCRNTHKVYRYNLTSGAYIGAFAGGSELRRADGLVYGPNGNLFVAAFQGDRVLEYNGQTGVFIRVFTQTGPNPPLDGPTGIAFGPSGNLFVASQGNESPDNRILEYTGPLDANPGRFVRVFAQGTAPGQGCDLVSPSWLVVRPNGHLLVSRNIADTHVVDYNGNGTCVDATFVGGGSSGLSSPRGLAIRPRAAVGSVVVWGSTNVPPPPNTGFTAIAAGLIHSLGLKDDGAITAWGYNQYGQCNVPAPNVDFAAVGGGGYFSLGLRRNGSIVAWGDNRWGQCNVPAPNAEFTNTTGSVAHSLGLKRDGSIVAWGLNDYGQCNVPAPNADYVAVAAGGGGSLNGGHSLGLKRDGFIVAWGHNGEGQCNVPAPNADFAAIAAGLVHNLGLKRDGSIVAWGYNGYGQCNVPAPNTGFVAVAAGWAHSLGLKTDGSIVAWGYNYDGQCTVPSPNLDFAEIAAGAYHSLGLKPAPLPIAGDLNCDTLRDAADIGPFVLALLDPAAYALTYPECPIARADLNADGSANGLDVSRFLNLLIGP